MEGDEYSAVIWKEFQIFSSQIEEEFEFWEIDDVDEFEEDWEKTRKVHVGLIGNHKKGVKKLLPSSKASFVHWWNESNLKSFCSKLEAD